MMIGVMNSNGYDATPRRDGKLGGCPWSSVTHDAGEGWSNWGDIIAAPRASDTCRVSYEVRGRRTGSVPILSVGQANVTYNGSIAVIQEVVETFTSARVRLGVLGPNVVIQIRAHATEDWEFQIREAYDLTVPVA